MLLDPFAVLGVEGLKMFVMIEVVDRPLQMRNIGPARLNLMVTESTVVKILTATLMTLQVDTRCETVAVSLCLREEAFVIGQGTVVDFYLFKAESVVAIPDIVTEITPIVIIVILGE